MSTQSQLDPPQLYDALVYSGSKWRPWLLWTLAGTMGGVLGSEASTLVPGYRLWVIPLIVVLFYGAKSVYGLLDRAYTPISIQGTLYFSIPFWIAFIVPLQTLSSRYSSLLIALIVGGGALLGCFHSVVLIRRVGRYKLWMGTGAAGGALASVAGVLVTRIMDAAPGDLQSSAAIGALVGSTYCAMLGAALLWIFWDSSYALEDIAGRFLQAGCMAESAIVFGLTISLRPDDSNLYYNRGTVYAQLEEPEQAIADFDKALSLNPDDAMAYGNRGTAYGDIGEFDLAFADFDKVRSLDPDDPFVFVNRGKVYLSMDDPNSAIREFDQAIERDPNNGMAYTNRGAAYSKLGNVQHAIEDYGLAIKQEPDYPNSYANRAFVYYKLGEYEKGVADCEQALSLRPDHAATHSNLGLNLAALGETERAAEAFSRALELPCDSIVREEALTGLRALGLDPDQ
jgi:tetratricopeptide (TPR) repeat protein